VPRRAKTIDLLRVVDLLQAHITPALCRTVFGAVRTTERQRVWTLEALIRFWTAVVLRAPKALTQALADSLEGRDPVYPRVEASPEAFFQRCRDLRPAFFAEVSQRFTARIPMPSPCRSPIGSWSQGNRWPVPSPSPVTSAEGPCDSGVQVPAAYSRKPCRSTECSVVPSRRARARAACWRSRGSPRNR
jgi:hypothetical protein